MSAADVGYEREWDEERDCCWDCGEHYGRDIENAQLRADLKTCWDLACAPYIDEDDYPTLNAIADRHPWLTEEQPSDD